MDILLSWTYKLQVRRGGEGGGGGGGSVRISQIRHYL